MRTWLLKGKWNKSTQQTQKNNVHSHTFNTTLIYSCWDDVCGYTGQNHRISKLCILLLLTRLKCSNALKIPAPHKWQKCYAVCSFIIFVRHCRDKHVWRDYRGESSCVLLHEHLPNMHVSLKLKTMPSIDCARQIYRLKYRIIQREKKQHILWT